MKSELATTHFATSCTCWCAVVVECINHLFTGGAKKKKTMLKKINLQHLYCSFFKGPDLISSIP
jgi:hypothetical protein